MIESTTPFLTIKRFIRMEVASSRPDHLPTLSAAKTFSTRQIAILVAELPMLAILLQCAGDIEADHTDSGIVMNSANRNRQIPHHGD